MSDMRIHRATSKDGTELAARVEGQGPPLVLLPAGPGDSETSWSALLPYVKERFTCYLMDTRGRGLSANHPDHSPDRLMEDVRSFIDSIGEPVRLLEWGTSLWARVAAESGDGITAIAAYEPGVNEVMPEGLASRLGPTFERVGALLAEGKLVEAARAFVENSDVLYVPAEREKVVPDFWVTAAPNLPVFMQEMQQAAESGQPSPNDPSVLGKIQVPVCLLLGTSSKQWFADSVHYVAKHVANSSVREIPGLPHFGPCLNPKPIADELSELFEP